MPSQPFLPKKPNQISQAELDLAMIQGTGNGAIFKIFKFLIVFIPSAIITMLFILIFNGVL